MEMIMGSNLVHLMLVGKHDSLPIRLGSRWMCKAFDIWGFIVWICVEVWPWRQPTAYEGNPARTRKSVHYFGFQFGRDGILLILVWLLTCRCRRG